MNEKNGELKNGNLETVRNKNKRRKHTRKNIILSKQLCFEHVVTN